MKKAILNGFSAYTGAGLADSFMGAGAAMQSGTATSWMGGEAPAAASTVSTPTMGANGIRASDVVYGSSPEVYRGPSYAAEAGNVSLASAAPAEVAQAAAAATPAAQAAQQAASLDTMNMSQRFDALKAGASGTNAMNYIKANPFASLGTATAMLTPDENKTPQKAADTDRGPRAGLSYYPGWTNPMPKPNMQGIEQPFNRPYYAAKGGVTRMATGGITSAPRNQQQLFADYLQRVSSSGVSGGTTPPTNKYDWWKSSGTDTPAAAPTETPEQYAARMSLNARGGGGGRTAPDEGVTFKEPTSEQAYNWSQAGKNISTISPLLGGVVGAYGNYLARRVDPNYSHEARHSLATPVGTEPAGGPIDYGPESGYMTNTDPYFSTQLGPGVGTTAYTDPYANVDFRTPAIEAEKAEKAEQAQVAAAEEAKGFQKQVFDADESKNARFSDYGPIKAERDRLEKEYVRGVDEAGIPYPPAFMDSMEKTVADYNATLRDANAKGLLSPEASKDAYSREVSALSRRSFPDTPEGNAKIYATSDRINTALDRINKLDSPFADRFAPEMTPTGATQDYRENAQNAINSLKPGSLLYAPADFSNQYLSPEAYQAEVDKANAAVTPAAEGTPYGTSPVPPGVSANQFAANYAAYNNSYAPSVPYQDTKFVEGKESPSTLMYGPNPNLVANADSYAQESGLSGVPPGISYNNFVRNYEAYNNPKTTLNVTPDIVGINEISADPNADKTTESLGIPDAATFAAMFGPSLGQYAAVNNGVVSDAGVSGDPALAGYQGGYNPGYATPNMGRGSSGVAAGFGGLGSAWRTALGLPVVDGQGRPILTSQGAAQQAYNESPQGVQDANDAETQSLSNRYPSGGRSSDGEGGGYSGNNSGDNAGWGRRDAGADGGLSTPYGFQHMANGGLSAMANPYDLGSYSDGGRLLKGPGDGVSDSIPATIGKGRPARLADGEFVIPARIVSEIGNGSTDAGARKLYAMMDRIQAGRKKSVGKGKVAVNSRAYKHLPA
jgi:hypothetical protein